MLHEALQEQYSQVGFPLHSASVENFNACSDSTTSHKTG